MGLSYLRASSALCLFARVVLLTGDGAALRTRSEWCPRQWQHSLSDSRSPSKVMKQKQAPVPRVVRAMPRPKCPLPKIESLVLSYVCHDLT